MAKLRANCCICLGQRKTRDKSNEITAIPELLDMLCTEDSIITIDAMGTQTAIAAKIIDGSGTVRPLKHRSRYFVGTL